MSGGGGDGAKTCGLTELLVFLAALVFGTLCSIMSKNMMNLRGEGITGEIELFEKPIFQTFGMFLGMLFALVMHFIVLALKIPFPGYSHEGQTQESAEDEEKGERSTLLKDAKKNEEPLETPVWMYFFFGHSGPVRFGRDRALHDGIEIHTCKHLSAASWIGYHFCCTYETKCSW